MTEQESREISDLSKAYMLAKIKYDNIGDRNTFGLKADELIDLGIQYNLAETEMWEAQAKLREAQRRIAVS